MPVHGLWTAAPNQVCNVTKCVHTKASAVFIAKCASLISEECARLLVLRESVTIQDLTSALQYVTVIEATGELDCVHQCCRRTDTR